MNSDIESINDGRLGDDDINSVGGGSMDKNHNHAKSSSSLVKSQSMNYSHNNRMSRSGRKDPLSNASPTFEKFGGSMLEVRPNNSRNSDASSSSSKNKKISRGAFKHRKNTENKFHPKLSSVGPKIIDEKFEEEDKEESSINSRQEESKYEESSSEEQSFSEGEDNSHEQPSESDIDNKYSLEASSIAEGGNFGRRVLESTGDRIHNKMTLAISESED